MKWQAMAEEGWYVAVSVKCSNGSLIRITDTSVENHDYSKTQHSDLVNDGGKIIHHSL